MKDWSLDNAKAKFSTVVALCCEDGPQIITRHGKPVAFVLSVQDYELMTRPSKRVNVEAKRRRLARNFAGRKLKGNAVLEERATGAL
jgi:prevent-host-death family protein